MGVVRWDWNTYVLQPQGRKLMKTETGKYFGADAGIQSLGQRTWSPAVEGAGPHVYKRDRCRRSRHLEWSSPCQSMVWSMAGVSFLSISAPALTRKDCLFRELEVGAFQCEQGPTLSCT